ncbi:microtubule-associated proteins 1A/1B light chain 3A-like [Rhopilema esculentum]|uniref:microtubule-associated proteins 1A/1B light chain 3A-like n=1 Tax=Rhopilema esculentum TaxID=499914 RepID=UPI0031D28D79
MSSSQPMRFKDKKTFHARKKDSEAILAQYPDKIPIIIEKYKNERNLPVLDKIKYLVPFDMTMGSLTSIIRKRLQLSSAQSLFMLVNQKSLTCASTVVGDVYKDDKDDDGFLYIVYASQEIFG